MSKRVLTNLFDRFTAALVCSLLGVALMLLVPAAVRAGPASEEEQRVWESLSSKVHELYGKGKFTSALQFALEREELALKVFGDRHAKYAESLNDIGLLQKTLGKFEEAERSYRRAIEIDRLASGPGHPLVAKKLNTLGNLLRETGRPIDALEVFKETVEIGEQHPEAKLSEVAAWYNNIASTYFDLALYSQAEQQFLKALKASRTADGPRHPNRARFLNNFSNVLIAQGRFKEAEARIKESLDIDIEVRGPDDPLLAFDLSSLALVYREQGLFAKAVPVLERALELRKKSYGEDHPFVAASMTSLASVLGPLGEDDRAEKLYLAAIAIDREKLGSSHPALGEDLQSLGGFQLRNNRPELAVKSLRESFEIGQRARGKSHPQLIEVLLNLGEAELRSGRRNDAVVTFEHALRIANSTVGEGHILHTRALGGLGRAERLQGNGERALVALRKAANGYANLRHAKGRRMLSVADEALDRRRNLSAAIAAAWEMGGKEGDTIAETLRWRQLISYSAAEDALIQQALRRRAPNHEVQVALRLQQELEEQISSAEALLYRKFSGQEKKDDETAITVLRKRVSQLKDELSRAAAHVKEAMPEASRFGDNQPLSVSEIQGKLGAGELLVVTLVAADDDGEKEYVFKWSIANKGPVKWRRVERKLGQTARDVTAVRCGLDFREWRGRGEARCQKLLGSKFTWNEAKLKKPLPFNLRKARNLYDVLLGASLDGLRDGGVRYNSLLIIPDGPISAVPFHALPTKSTVQEFLNADGASVQDLGWLGARTAISLVPAISSLSALRLSKPAGAIVRKAYIGFGNPRLEGGAGTPEILSSYAANWDRCSNAERKRVCQQAFPATNTTSGRPIDPRDIRRWSPLPQTACELCSIAASLSVANADEVIRLSSRASETVVKSLGGLAEGASRSQLQNYRVVHFATHGSTAGWRGISEPGLILTPPVEGAEGELDDGFLSAKEVVSLKLDADWVILSACNTAAGTSEDKETLSGLARAFFFAGARAILVSHWEVYTNAAVDLTTRTLVMMDEDHKVGRSEAMRRAIEEMIEQAANDNDAFRLHPSYWAAFSIVGEGGR